MTRAPNTAKTVRVPIRIGGGILFDSRSGQIERTVPQDDECGLALVGPAVDEWNRSTGSAVTDVESNGTPPVPELRSDIPDYSPESP